MVLNNSKNTIVSLKKAPNSYHNSLSLFSLSFSLSLSFFSLSFLSFCFRFVSSFVLLVQCCFFSELFILSSRFSKVQSWVTFSVCVMLLQFEFLVMKNYMLIVSLKKQVKKKLQPLTRNITAKWKNVDCNTRKK